MIRSAEHSSALSVVYGARGFAGVMTGKRSLLASGKWATGNLYSYQQSKSSAFEKVQR